MLIQYISFLVIFLILSLTTNGKRNATEVSSPPNTLQAVCQFDSHYQSWNGQQYSFCDKKMCKGRDKVHNLTSSQDSALIETILNRFGSNTLLSYLSSVDDGSIEGWLQPIHVRLIFDLTFHQHSMGIYGTVGEIGLYKGKFFFGIAGFAHKREPVLGIDLFGDHHLEANVYHGLKLSEFETLMKTYVGEINGIVILSKDSTQFVVSDYVRLKMPMIRYFSVDGAHQLEAILHDMNLVACLIVDGGVMVLNDFLNEEWLGVTAAAVMFTVSQNRLAPFLWIEKKLYFTTPSYHKIMTDLITKMSHISCNDEYLHISRRSIGRWSVLHCYPVDADKQSIDYFKYLFNHLDRIAVT